MHKIVKSTAHPVGDGRAGTPTWDKIKCSKLEDFPTNPSFGHPCPSPPVAVICHSDMESPSRIQEHSRLFLSLNSSSVSSSGYRRCRASPPDPLHPTSPLASSAHPLLSCLCTCSLTRRAFPPPTHHKHSTQVHPHLPPAEACSCLPGSTEASQSDTGHSAALLSVVLLGPPHCRLIPVPSV